MAKPHGHTPTPSPQVRRTTHRPWRAALPFIIAGVVVLVVVIGVLISNAVRPAESRMSDDALVQHAINDYYTARNEADFGKFAAVNCAAVRNAGFPAEDTFVTDNRKSMADNGQIMIPEITDLTSTATGQPPSTLAFREIGRQRRTSSAPPWCARTANGSVHAVTYAGDLTPRKHGMRSKPTRCRSGGLSHSRGMELRRRTRPRILGKRTVFIEWVGFPTVRPTRRSWRSFATRVCATATR